MHKTISLQGEDAFVPAFYKQQLLNWASRFNSCCLLDNHQYDSLLHANEFLLAAGVFSQITLNNAHTLTDTDDFLASNHGQWIFGHISYELMHATHALPCDKPDKIKFPLLTLFVPQVVFKCNNKQLEILVQDPGLNTENIWQEVLASKPAVLPVSVPEIYPKISRQGYIDIVNKLRVHILRGDCYEINFCQEFVAEGTALNPLAVYHALAGASPNPFACYYKHKESHLMCASPERYLTKRSDKLFSQPIKGTALRYPKDIVADEASKQALRTSKKELSENVMVVDLVRNDLSRICEKGSVQVDELYGIYSYPHVHQMISTISGVLKTDTPFSEILHATFPMGSMTGAPKIRVMELIEQYEPSRRGLFAGAVGYIAPNGDFDFNVVIRSILYNEQTQYLSYLVGSGITWYSKAEEEYEECLWKAEAIRRVLGLEV